MARLTMLAAVGVTVLLAPIAALNHTALYDGGVHTCADAPVELRIGNGGAGESGLIKALADAFIQHRMRIGRAPFRIAWFASDTTYSIANLQRGHIDVAITYNSYAELVAMQQGSIAASTYYVFRDHFLLVGPASNPAGISNHSDIKRIFSEIYAAAEDPATRGRVRFLSRFDKSATNIKESSLWTAIGQVPWAHSYSTWYHQFMAFPIPALRTAILLEEYTITDRGTYLSIDAWLRSKVVVYKQGTDDAFDPLLNPAHLITSLKPLNKDLARAFGFWLVSPEGQDVIRSFMKNGEQLYSPAPPILVSGAA